MNILFGLWPYSDNNTFYWWDSITVYNYRINKAKNGLEYETELYVYSKVIKKTIKNIVKSREIRFFYYNYIQLNKVF